MSDTYEDQEARFTEEDKMRCYTGNDCPTCGHWMEEGEDSCPDCERQDYLQDEAMGDWLHAIEIGVLDRDIPGYPRPFTPVTFGDLLLQITR